MSTLLLALWPLFALILLGYWIFHRGWLGDGFWQGADRLNYFLLFPALLFANLSRAPLRGPATGELALAVACGIGVAWIALLVLRRLRGWPAARFGVFAQGTLRFNTYLGLATVGALFGPPGLALASLVLGLMVPLVNLLSVWALAAGQGVSARQLARSILRNPLILACAAGALVNLLGVPLPPGTPRLLELLGTASLPLGLLCVGAALRPRQLKHEAHGLAAITLARLLLMPALAALVAWALALPPLEQVLLVLFFALPTAPTSYALTRQMGGDTLLMAGTITLQTLAAAISLPLVLAVVS